MWAVYWWWKSRHSKEWETTAEASLDVTPTKSFQQHVSLLKATAISGRVAVLNFLIVEHYQRHIYQHPNDQTGVLVREDRTKFSSLSVWEDFERGCPGHGRGETQLEVMVFLIWETVTPNWLTDSFRECPSLHNVKIRILLVKRLSESVLDLSAYLRSLVSIKMGRSSSSWCGNLTIHFVGMLVNVWRCLFL